MAKSSIKYTGRDDLRILSAADLEKADVEGFTKTSFARGEAVEVDSKVAKAIIDDPALFGKFEAVEREAEPTDSTAATKSAASK